MDFVISDGFSATAVYFSGEPRVRGEETGYSDTTFVKLTPQLSYSQPAAGY